MDVVTPEQSRIAEVSLGLGKAMPGTIPKEPRDFVASFQAYFTQRSIALKKKVI